MSRQHVRSLPHLRRPVVLVTACVLGILLLAHGQRSAAVAPSAGLMPFDASILVYHRFGAVVKDPMTVRTSTFRAQLEYLARNRYAVVPLRALVLYLLGRGPALPPRAVCITVDDGHESVFTDMRPVLMAYGFPATLFIYPSAISNASYAMTWEQLNWLHQTRLFDIESHTYWHPRFDRERKRLSPAAYDTFVALQLTKPRTIIKGRTGDEPDLIAWPFGVYDDDLLDRAQRAGYISGVTLERRRVTRDDRVMALPRFLVSDGDVGARFAALLPGDVR